MRKLHKVELEVGTAYKRISGIGMTAPLAFVSIETENEGLRDALVQAISTLDGWTA